MKAMIIVALLTAACATVAIEPFRPEVVTKDDPTNAKMTVEITNNTASDICLETTSWPDANGNIDSAAGSVSIAISGKKFPITEMQIGYCPNCGFKVEKNKKLIGSLNYSDFNIPKELYFENKILSFHPIAHSCSR